MKNGYLYINDNIFQTLIALSEEEQTKGLMHQPWPPPVMSFIYKYPKPVQFWMKNTPSPLDIVFSYNGKITEICKGEPYSTNLIGRGIDTDLVVEFPYGTMNDLNIKVGSNIELFNPTKEQLKKII
jgi:hypothetical protein